jgi:hypothetical protein
MSIDGLLSASKMMAYKFRVKKSSSGEFKNRHFEILPPFRLINPTVSEVFVKIISF